jgi:hypothetical protein
MKRKLIDRTVYGRSQSGCVRRQVGAHGRARDHQDDLRRRFDAFQAMAD